MKDYLIDIVKHTVSLGCFDNLRVDGTDKETKLSSTEKERTVVLRAKLHGVIPEFEGLFGVPNLPLLNTLLNIPEYQDDGAKLTVDRRAVNNLEQPVNIKFENATGDFKNEFRLMASNIIENIEPLLKFNVTSWPCTFVPTVAAQQRLKYQTSAHPEEKAVTFRVENGEVRAMIGDGSSHNGSFVFHTGVDKKVKETIVVPVLVVNSVLTLSGDKTVQMGGPGMMISVDSGLANYDYIIPMLSK
jgi:hypothetical protein